MFRRFQFIKFTIHIGPFVCLFGETHYFQMLIGTIKIILVFRNSSNVFYLIIFKFSNKTVINNLMRVSHKTKNENLALRQPLKNETF